jgi:hypothetical protein
MLTCGEADGEANLSEPAFHMDCRVIGERSDAVLRTAMPDNDESRAFSRRMCARVFADTTRKEPNLIPS